MKTVGWISHDMKISGVCECISRVSDHNGVSLPYVEGFRPEWCISTIQGSHFPVVSRISAKMKFQNPRKKKLIREKKSGPIYFLKRQLKLTQTASKLQP